MEGRISRWWSIIRRPRRTRRRFARCSRCRRSGRGNADGGGSNHAVDAVRFVDALMSSTPFERIRRAGSGQLRSISERVDYNPEDETRVDGGTDSRWSPCQDRKYGTHLRETRRSTELWDFCISMELCAIPVILQFCTATHGMIVRLTA